MTGVDNARLQDSEYNIEDKPKSSFSYHSSPTARQKEFVSTVFQLEKKWYASAEELNERGYIFLSNICSLGVLLFEVTINFFAVK